MRVTVASGHATWWMDIVLTVEDVCRTGLLQLPERQHAVRLYAGRHNETQNPTEVPMSDLIVIVYPSEEKAEEVRQRLFKLQKEYLITINDAVIAVKTEAGAVKLNQLVNATAIGAASGSFWGLLVGVLFLNPLLGVALGAASGALGGKLTDYGINDAFMKELSETLQPGKAALFVLVQEMTADKVLKEIRDAGGTVLKTSLDDSKETALREALAKATATASEPSSST